MKTIKSCFTHDSYYPHQEEVLDILDDNIDKYDWFLLEAPPGIGKSAIARAVASYFGEADVLTRQIRLQNQYVDGYEFKKVEGRSHSFCKLNNLDCSQGVCMTTDKKCDFSPTIKNVGEFAAFSKKRDELYWGGEEQCDYWKQKMDALKYGLVTHNYSYYLYETNYAGDFGSPKVLIGDECHNIESAIMSFINIEISERDGRILDIDFSKYKTTDDWMYLFEEIVNVRIPERHAEIREDLKEISKQEKGTPSAKFSTYNPKQLSIFRDRLFKEDAKLIKIQNKIIFFLDDSKNNQGNWIIIPDYNKERKEVTRIEVKPLRVHGFVKDKLFKKSKKIFLMSATILNFETFKKSIGIDNEKCLGIQIPSPFPIENRLIYKGNIGNLNADAVNPKYKGNKLNDIVNAIDEILSCPDFRDVKGIIHTTTYNLAEYIANKTKHKDRIVTHTNSKEAGELLEAHKKTKKPKVIVSPSMGEGVSLDNDLSRIQIVINVPYGNTYDPVVKSRAEIDPDWYYWKTGIDLFQKLGRSNRNMTDYCTSIVLDSRLHYFLWKQLGYSSVPGWILDSITSKAELCSKFNLSLDYSKK